MATQRKEKEKSTILDFEIRIFVLPLLQSEEWLQAKEQLKLQDSDFQTHVFPTYPHTNRHPFVSRVLLPTSKPKITPYGQQGQTALLPMKLYDSTRTLMIFKKGQ